MLKTEDLWFSYGDGEDILKELNIIIENGEFAGIIGPNGSGKSTFIKNVSSIFEPDHGVVYINGSRVEKLSSQDLARRMAVVPQETAINFDFTVYDLVMMGRNPYQNRWGRTREEDRQRVEEAMALTDTRQFYDKNIDQLSGGEKQRVIIARALAQDPDILLLDEPTSSLDINYQGEIFDLLSYLNRERDLTILIVSHDLNLSGQYCQRLILLEEGRIHSTGSPEEVLTEQNIADVYKASVIVENNRLTGRPSITILPGEQEGYCERLKSTGSVHVICGGGNAKSILQRLYYQGFDVSCGILNQGDSDWDIARRLGFSVVDIPPFAYIEEENLHENSEKIEKADMILVADLPFGHGNIDNLLQLKDFPGKNIILLEERSIEERDYTEGRAAVAWKELKERKGTFVAQNEDEMFKELTRTFADREEEPKFMRGGNCD